MHIEKTYSIDGIKLISLPVFGDHRGSFKETYHVEKFNKLGIQDMFIQDNESHSKKGILRGLHLQSPPKSQAKLVRVLHGSIFDVVVDINPDSPTFGQWVTQELTASKPQLFYVPNTCAHGFLVTSDSATVQYKCSDLYSPEHEVSIQWNDPELNIDWPLNSDSPQLSEKDLKGISWKNYVDNITP